MYSDYRLLCPVGQGGFDIEFIDGTTIVFDCGSRPKANVENCIIHYRNYQINNGIYPQIDYLFLSHFDKDHVIGLDLLAQYFKIKNIIVPYIPKKYRVLYNYVTNYSVSLFYDVMNSNENLRLVRIYGTKLDNQNTFQSIQSVNGKWKWVFKSLFSKDQWKVLNSKLFKKGLIKKNEEDEEDFFFNDFDKGLKIDKNYHKKIRALMERKDREFNITDIDYPITIAEFDIRSYKDEIELSNKIIQEINKTIGDHFKSLGESKKSFAKNENGLLLLSMKNYKPVISSLYETSLLNNHHLIKHSRLSACIYTGDMRFDIKSCPTILSFLSIAGENLLLFQIPHHGSSHNSSDIDISHIPSYLFFWHDKNYQRIKKNNIINNGNNLFLIDTVVGLHCVFHFK